MRRMARNNKAILAIKKDEVLSHLLEGCMVLRQIGLLRTHYAISSTKLLKEDWQAC